MGHPGVSVVVPTLNSGRTLRACLASIRAQRYDGSVQLILADAGSTDDTLAIGREFGAELVLNPLRTGEAGKSVGLRRAVHGLVAFIDSDNILPGIDWLVRMIEPFAEPEVTLAEPIEYTHRRTDGFLTRYCALMGMNDPLCFFLGNYDRINGMTGRWTEVPVRVEERERDLRVVLASPVTPTVGANGTIFRRLALSEWLPRDYFFDIDVAADLLRAGHAFAKVKIGIIHVFSGDVRTFVRKQQRRVLDYLHYRRRGERSFPWASGRSGVVWFVISTILVVPLVVQTLRGYARRPDVAWFFHPVACWLTLLVYGTGVLRSIIRTRESTRHAWSQ